MIPTTLNRPLIGSRTLAGFGHDAHVLRARPQGMIAQSSLPASLQITLRNTLEELQGLESLEPDWDGEDASEIDPIAITWAHWFIVMLARSIPLQVCTSDIPMVAPTPEGGVSLSWHLPTIMLWLIIHPDNEVFTYISKGHQAKPLRRTLAPRDALVAVLTGLGAL